MSSALSYTKRAYSLEHKKRYNIVTGEEKYIIYVLHQVRTDFPLLYVYKIVVLQAAKTINLS